MSARRTVSIPVRPFINRFALANCGNGERISETRCGVQVWATLNDELQIPVAGLVTDNAMVGLRHDTLGVILVTHKHVDVSADTCKRLNLRLGALFRADLCSFVDFLLGYSRIEKKKALLTYAERNGIAVGDDINYQSLVRIYWLHERRLRGEKSPSYLW